MEVFFQCRFQLRSLWEILSKMGASDGGIFPVQIPAEVIVENPLEDGASDGLQIF
jgi:hypothetical protein